VASLDEDLAQPPVLVLALLFKGLLQDDLRNEPALDEDRAEGAPILRAFGGGEDGLMLEIALLQLDAVLPRESLSER
jgi:predicted glycosyltransferase